MSAGRRALLIGAIVSATLAAAVAACTDIPTGPDAVFSLGFERVPFLAVVTGDTLRSADGAAVRVRAVAYNGAGEPIPDAAITYFADPGVTVTADGFVIAGATVRPTVRIFASVGGLTTLPETLAVVTTPLALELVQPAPDSLPYTDPAPISPAVATILRGAPPVGSPGETPGLAVPRWIVRYAVRFRGAILGDTNPIFSVVAPGGGRLSPVDTTDQSGRAERAVALLDPTAVAPGDIAELLIVASYRGEPVGGDTVRVPLRVARSGP